MLVNLSSVRPSLHQGAVLGDDADEVKTTEKFARLLPSLIINIALCSLDWQSTDTLIQKLIFHVTFLFLYCRSRV